MMHVYPISPTGLEHSFSGTWCWCNPEYRKVCLACQGAKVGCDACQGSGLTRTDVSDPDLCLVVHRHEGKERTCPAT